MAKYPRVITQAQEVEVPIVEGVDIKVSGSKITVTGPKGTLEKSFHDEIVEIIKGDGTIKVRVYGKRKFHRAYLNTVASHIRNMMKGVTEGFSKEMVIVYAHFPIKVEVDEARKMVKITNFLGERAPRYAKIVGDTKVRVEGDRIYIEGISKEDVGQTAANIRQATKIKDKDPRVFMDGIYVVK
ncbi:MAG: 50S ribosomal protein L6 [Candidatus Korarchaeota archaeon]|nr:50S ribosomal protein L6 [Candidatus Korarchaeota archaeon]